MRLVEIQECCNIINGSTPSRKKKEFWDGDISWFTPKDLSGLESKYIEDSPEYITKEGYNSCSTTLVPIGSLLFTSRAPIGHLAINKKEACTNQGFKTLVPKDGVDVEYLYYALKKNVPQLKDLGNGATFKELSKATISKFKIPLPPLDQQKKIAAILDAADAYRQKTKALIEKYDELTQSLFLDMFGDPVTNPKGWDKVALNELCDFKKTSLKPEEIETGDTYIGLECIEKQTGKILERFIVEAGEIKSNKFWFDSNYILYGKLRPYLNKVANPDFEGVCSTDIIPIRPILKNTAKEFIISLLRGSWFVSFADERCSGANLPRISPKEVEKYQTINPPIKLQNQFAERAQAIEGQKAQAQASLAGAEDLFNSLLQRAFNGELTN